MKRFASLTSRLVVTAVALVALVSLLIGATTALAMRDYLTDRLDDEVAASLTGRIAPRRRAVSRTVTGTSTGTATARPRARSAR